MATQARGATSTAGATGTHDDLVTVRGTVERLYFSSPHYSAGRFTNSEDGRLISFAGKVSLHEGQPCVLHGRFVNHPKYGSQLEVTSLEIDRQMDARGLANYLAKDPEFRDIGPVRARLIADTFGTSFEHTLLEHPQRIADVAKVPLSVIERLRIRWLESTQVNLAMTALSAYGLTHHQATTLVQKWGDAAVGIVEDNPYVLSAEIDGWGFKRVDTIARAVGIPKESSNRVRSGILYCLEEALDRGDCWIDYEALIDTANKLLLMDNLDSREVIERELDGLVEAGLLICHSSGGRFLVALPTIWEMESDLADALSNGHQPNEIFQDVPVEQVISTLTELDLHLNDAQREAILRATGCRISLISGGAGSGKTYTVAALVKLCEALDVEVSLAAPTGKAAKRMEQSSGMEAQTIHRLLGWNTREWAYNSSNPLPGGLLIVDETSMMDVPLAWRLFQAIDWDTTSLVLVGDHNQLPPVGPGNILRDLIESEAVTTTILGTIMRQAGILKENCNAILTGEVRKGGGEADGVWYVADQHTDSAKLQTFILRLFDEALERLGYDILRDVQLLTPTHKGPIGTLEMNTKLQQLYQRKLWHREAEPVAFGKRPKLMTNDRVIQTKNNYKLNVMNGATGIVREVGSDGSLTIDFDGQIVELEQGAPERQHIQLAYALTIHKAQGSEYPCSVVVVHKSHSFMHHRNLLYTGVTRAQRTAIIVGDHWGIGNCAKKVSVDTRKTFLSLSLGQAGAAQRGEAA